VQRVGRVMMALAVLAALAGLLGPGPLGVCEPIGGRGCRALDGRAGAR
jgi:hypothetical protein